MYKYDASLTKGFHLNNSEIYISYIDYGYNGLQTDLRKFFALKFSDINAEAIIDKNIEIDGIVPYVTRVYSNTSLPLLHPNRYTRNDTVCNYTIQ